MRKEVLLVVFVVVIVADEVHQDDTVNVKESVSNAVDGKPDLKSARGLLVKAALEPLELTLQDVCGLANGVLLRGGGGAPVHAVHGSLYAELKRTQGAKSFVEAVHKLSPIAVLGRAATGSNAGGNLGNYVGELLVELLEARSDLGHFR